MCILCDKLLRSVDWTGYLLVMHLLRSWKVCILVLHVVDKQRLLRMCSRNFFAWRGDDLHFLRVGIILQRRRRCHWVRELCDVRCWKISDIRLH